MEKASFYIIILTYLGAVAVSASRSGANRSRRFFFPVKGLAPPWPGTSKSDHDTSAIIDGRIADVFETKSFFQALDCQTFILKELPGHCQFQRQGQAPRGLSFGRSQVGIPQYQVKGNLLKDYRRLKKVDGKCEVADGARTGA